MRHPALQAEALYSTLGDDPDLGELVTMFVEEMHDRIATLQQSHRDGDVETLGRVAHQLKGASGSYGFNQITDFAARLERAVRQNAAEQEVLESLQELVLVCGKLRDGTPG